MSSELSAEEQTLKSLVEDSESVLTGLEWDLSEVNRELADLAQQNHRYELLSQVCRSLEDLESMGAADLFWGAPSESGVSEQYINGAHSRISAYSDEIARIEKARESIMEQIGDQNEALDALHYDLRDAVEREESRKNEWLVENEQHERPSRPQIMPWTRGSEEDQFFRRSLAASVLAGLILGLLVSAIDLPIPDFERRAEVPERVAKLVRKVEPPPPEPVAPEPVIEEIEEPEPQLVEEVPEEDLPKAESDAPQVAEAPQPDTREQVKTKGILAFRESFASAASLRTSAKLGSQARISNSGNEAVGRTTRDMVSTSAPGSSGGINLASISRDVGGPGGGLEGVEVGQVASAIEGAEGPDRPLSGGALAGRTDEEIQIVFDRYKAALYRLYNRELRKDPTLRGQLVLRLTIEPDGSVSVCTLQSSDMDAPILADQVVNRVSTFDFGAKDDITAVTIVYPIDFLPAA